ncbi:MAG: BT_3928 family protein [Paludibacteraceae bacterium]
MFKPRSRYSNAKTTKVTTIWQKTSTVILEIIRIVLGAVFLFSGFVKAIDPLGSTYKIQDYLTSFGESFVVFHPAALPAAVALSTLELLVGFCFLFKIKLKTTSIVALIFMSVMLPLTLYIALNNPVTDCGCFGDALVLSNWNTFYKNVALFVMILLTLTYHKKMRNLFLPGVEWSLILVFVVAGVGLSGYSYRHLPMMDFRPYKIGVNIPEAMKTPQGMPADKYDTKLIYEREGVKKEFTIDNYPKDSTWTFVEQKTILVSKGYEPPIHNFEIIDEQGNNITDDVMHYQGNTYLVIMYDLTKSVSKGADKAELLFDKTNSNEDRFYALTSASDRDIEKFKRETGISFSFYKTDPITLKTIIRSNPGFVKIKDGVITGKWAWRDFDAGNE